LAATVVALERRGFGIDVVHDFEAARSAVLARIPNGVSVLTDQSLAVMQLQTMKAVSSEVDFAVAGVDAVTQDGVLVIASASGTELASYTSEAANVILVVGAQNLVPDLDTAVRRIAELGSPVGKILQIHREDPGRIHVVLVRASPGRTPGSSTGATGTPEAQA
jgi:hypothetical protein